MALADALGNLTDFRPGQAHGLRGMAALIERLACGKFLGDRAFDANRLREALDDAGIEAVIAPKPNRRCPAELARDTSKWRHFIDLRQENDPPDHFQFYFIFGKLKEYKGIAMRCCKTDESFRAFLSPAATVIRSK